MTVLVDPVPSGAHHGWVRMGANLGVYRFDPKRIDHRDGAELMVGNLDAGDATLRDGSSTRQRRSTDADDSEDTSGGILNGLLHVLAKVAHLGPLSVWACSRSHIGCSVPQADGGDLSS